MAWIYFIEGSGEEVLEELVRAFLLTALAVFVIVTSRLGRPRRREGITEFPPAWGTRIVLWITIGLWTLMAWASVDVGIYWLAFLLMWGPLLTLWRWPAVICVDEISIRAVAPLRSQVRINWNEIESVTPSAAGDAVIVRSRSGEKIKVPFSQVGAEELVEIISDMTEFKCKYEEPEVL